MNVPLGALTIPRLSMLMMPPLPRIILARSQEKVSPMATVTKEVVDDDDSDPSDGDDVKDILNAAIEAEGDQEFEEADVMHTSAAAAAQTFDRQQLTALQSYQRLEGIGESREVAMGRQRHLRNRN
jgi:hypothetical protein